MVTRTQVVESRVRNLYLETILYWPLDVTSEDAARNQGREYHILPKICENRIILLTL